MGAAENAIRFLSSARGSYIVSQALWVAIETMNKVPKKEREFSNISDMQYLLDDLFPIFKAVKAATPKEEDKMVRYSRMSNGKGWYVSTFKQVCAEECEMCKAMNRFINDESISVQHSRSLNLCKGNLKRHLAAGKHWKQISYHYTKEAEI